MLEKIFRHKPNLWLNIPIRSLTTKASPNQNDFSLIKKQEKEEIKNILENVNKSAQDVKSRLFAVVMLAGSQFKVTTEDVIMVRNHFYPTIGERIRLEKVGWVVKLLDIVFENKTR